MSLLLQLIISVEFSIRQLDQESEMYRDCGAPNLMPIILRFFTQTASELFFVSFFRTQFTSSAPPDCHYIRPF